MPHFDVRTDYLLGKSDDTSSVKLTDEDIEQLGRWKFEEAFTDIFKIYLSLDSFGKSTVESLIKSERLRCHEQSAIEDTSKIKISISIEKNNNKTN